MDPFRVSGIERSKLTLSTQIIEPSAVITDRRTPNVPQKSIQSGTPDYLRERWSTRIADKLADMKVKSHLRRVLIRWYQEVNQPCPSLGFEHVDPTVRLATISNLVKRVTATRNSDLSRLILTQWRLYTIHEARRLEKQSGFCALKIANRERAHMSLSFHNWLRLLDDMRMGRAAARIRADSEKLLKTQHKLISEESKSDKIIDLLTGVLNHTEAQSLLGRAFFHWLTKSRKSTPSSVFSKQAGDGVGKRQQGQQRPPPSSSANDHLFESPAWPGPFDILPLSVSSVDGRLPPLTPLYLGGKRTDEGYIVEEERKAEVSRRSDAADPSTARPAKDATRETTRQGVDAKKGDGGKAITKKREKDATEVMSKVDREMAEAVARKLGDVQRIGTEPPVENSRPPRASRDDDKGKRSISPPERGSAVPTPPIKSDRGGDTPQSGSTPSGGPGREKTPRSEGSSRTGSSGSSGSGSKDSQSTGSYTSSSCSSGTPSVRPSGTPTTLVNPVASRTPPVLSDLAKKTETPPVRSATRTPAVPQNPTPPVAGSKAVTPTQVATPPVNPPGGVPPVPPKQSSLPSASSQSTPLSRASVLDGGLGVIRVRTPSDHSQGGSAAGTPPAAIVSVHASSKSSTPSAVSRDRSRDGEPVRERSHESLKPVESTLPVPPKTDVPEDHDDAQVKAGADASDASSESSDTSSSGSLSHSSSSSGSSSSSDSANSSSEEGKAPIFKLSLLFFMRMRRVVRQWAQRARDTVAQHRVQASIDAAVEEAVNSWRPQGVPLDLFTAMPVAEALSVFAAGAAVMKRKGAVTQIDVDEQWFQFGGLKDQPRFLVGQIENTEQLVLYYVSQRAVETGKEPRGWFSLEELKMAKFSYRLKEIGVYSDFKGSVPVMKKISKIPERFFIALVICVRYAIGAQMRKNRGVGNLLGARAKGPG